MASFTNNGVGLRGIVMKDLSTVWLEPGVTVELDKRSVANVHAEIDEQSTSKAAKEAQEPTKEG